MRILLFGDGAWAAKSLEAVVQAGHDVCAVIPRAFPSDRSLEESAGRLGIAVAHPRQSVNEPEFVRWVVGQRPDLNVSISFDEIFGPPLISSATKGFINCHAGKLPAYRGCNVINWAIINGENELGLTVHYVDEGVDTGDIILQKTIPISFTDTYGNVLEKAVAEFPSLLVEAIRHIAEGRPAKLQGRDAGFYVSRRISGDEWIDWTRSSLEIYNFVRAITDPGPGAQTLLNDEIVKVWAACYKPGWPSYKATVGEVVGRDHEGVYVKTGDSVLLLTEIQHAGFSREVPRLRIGSRFIPHVSPAALGLAERVARLEKMVDELKESLHREQTHRG